MNMFCDDRDLLAAEPVIFIADGMPGQCLTSGSDGVISETNFSSAAGKFQAANLSAGMVLVAYSTARADAATMEIISIESQTSMTVSLLRAATDAALISPAAGASRHYYVRTYRPVIANVSAALGEKLRQVAESAGVTANEFTASQQLRDVTVCGALAAIFAARADGENSSDIYWTKARHYHDLFTQRQSQLRLAVDLDGDGVAERTRSLGNVQLRRI